MAFCLPFSTALTLIFSVFGTLFSLVGFDWEAFKKVIRHPIAILCVALFGWLTLSMLWSIAPRDEMIEGLSKYRKLLYVPLIGMLLITTRVKPWFLMNFFVAGCLVVCVGSLFSSTGLAELVLGPQNSGGGGWLLGGSPDKSWFFIGPPEKPTFGRAHIAQGAFLAFAAAMGAALLLNRFFEKKLTLSFLLSSLGVIIVLNHVIINIGGLTGYVLIIVAGIGLVVISGRLGGWRVNAIVIAIFFGFVITTFLISDTYKKRVTESIGHSQEYFKEQRLTSEGIRLEFWKVGIKRFIESPLVGYGVGSYGELYQRFGTREDSIRSSRPHPHSEYVIQIVQGGIVAFGLFLFLVITVFSGLMKKIKSGQMAICFDKRLGVMLVVMFYADAIFNSTIWDLAEGHWFSILMATYMQVSYTCRRNSDYKNWY